MEEQSSGAINQLRQDARSVVRELGLLNDAYFEIGVTLAERHLLIELTVCTSPTMGEIAERLLLDKSTVSRLISKAVKKGYVKCITDKSDKRKRFLQLTEKGKQVLNAFEPIAFNQTKEALLTLTSKEIETVYQGVALYARGLRHARLKSSPMHDRGKKIESLDVIREHLNQLGYVLELFKKQDEEDLYQIFREVVDSGSQFPYACNSMREFHKQFLSPQGKVYVCRSHNGDVIGGFFIRPNFSGGSNDIANAAYMIQGAYRGRGIGSLLVKASLHLAKDSGFKAMQFNLVLSRNTLAIKLYEKLGFNIIRTLPGVVQSPDGNYQDGCIMYRNLGNL